MSERKASDWHGLGALQFTSLAEQYGTPFYLMDADAVARKIAVVRDAMQGMASIYYAVKANPNLGLLRAVRPAADGLDISSGGELEQALLAGYAPDTMSFAGPAKTQNELEAAIVAGVGAISVESPRELMECVRIARQHSKRAMVALRINPKMPSRSFGMKMGGKPIQFGIDEEDLPEALSLLRAHSEQLHFRGIHVYAGSQCFDQADLVGGIKNTLAIAADVEKQSRLVCEKINFGGGFGISHSQRNTEIDVRAVGEQIAPILREVQSVHGIRRELIFELGRYLTADAGIYVVRVVSEKMSRGKRFYAVDGGLNHHLAAAGTFGTALRHNFLMQNLSDREAPLERCSIAGPSCNPTDLLAVDTELPRPEQGDLLAVEMSGSYGLTASPLLFLGRRTPAELILQSGKVIIGRRSMGILDFN